MALNRSPVFKGVSVQIVCVVEIQFESAWAILDRDLHLNKLEKGQLGSAMCQISSI